MALVRLGCCRRLPDDSFQISWVTVERCFISSQQTDVSCCCYSGVNDNKSASGFFKMLQCFKCTQHMHFTAVLHLRSALFLWSHNISTVQPQPQYLWLTVYPNPVTRKSLWISTSLSPPQNTNTKYPSQNSNPSLPQPLVGKMPPLLSDKHAPMCLFLYRGLKA